MKPVLFDGVNAVYTADGCEKLPALVENNDEWGTNVTTSVWRPSKDDLLVLNSGGCVCLQVVGEQPPVCIYAEHIKTIEPEIKGACQITIKKPSHD